MPLRYETFIHCVTVKRFCALAIVIGCVGSIGTHAAGQEFDEPPAPVADEPVEFIPEVDPVDQPPLPEIADVGLKFSFDRTPWRDVIKWLADEAELALHIQDLPTGSFTYDDQAEFTVPEAIDRVNLFLLSQGYTLVRSGRLLSVINLGDPRSLEQLDALAKLVDQKELDELSDYDVVKCIFPLGDLKAEDAVEELSALKLMTKPAVFAKTNRLMLTDSVAKLKSVRVILNGFEAKTLDNGTVMKNFTLQHVDAEDILTVARPHLGLATGEMIGIDVSISADLLGKNIFVTGVDDKVKLIEGLVSSLDKSDKDLNAEDAPPELKAYEIEGGNVETVYNVLLTLLAGKTVRLSMDEKANNIVALATPGIQREIEATVAKLQASVAEFEIIPLKNVDPYLAVNLLEQMLDLRTPTTTTESKKKGTQEDIAYAPKIDADATNMRLFVHAKKQDIEMIREMVGKIDANEGEDENAELRIFPMRGEQAEQALITAAKFWREQNPIILFPTTAKQQRKTERVVAEQDDEKVDQREQGDVKTNSNSQRITSPRVLGGDGLSRKPVIRCEITGEGVVMHSYDTVALSRFYDQLRTLAGRADLNPSPPVVFYLKHSRTDDAVRMLAELLDGGEAVEAKEGENSLVNGYLYSSTLSLGSLVTTKEGLTTLTSGTITVIADSRLNRLIAQGTESDIELIENYLKIVDKDNSITDVETYGKSHLIELQNANANEVAAAIRQAFTGRINAAAPSLQSGNSNGSVRQPQQQPNAPDDQQNGGNGKQKKDQQRSAPVRNLEPKMTIAVHESSNSLIVTAPDALYQQVEQLVKLIDIRDEQSVEIISTSDAAVYDAVMNVIAERARNGATPTSSRTEGSRNGIPARTNIPTRSGNSAKGSN